MPSDVTREEFQHLATRTDILEREVEGEKMVTRHILEQSRRNGDDIAGVKTRLDQVEKRLEGRIDGVEARLDGVERKVDGLSREFREWRRELPGIVSDIVRDAIKPLMHKR
jgi:tetrahydromethanopterin S-methyltransferase subunit G